MLNDLRFRLRALFQRRGMDAEMDDELQFHFEQQVKKLVAAGLSRVEADRQARLMFGGTQQIREDCRQSRGLKFVETTSQGFRYGLRMLLKTPGVTLVAVLTLALGIGANTAIFSVLDALMFKQLPVADPARLVQLRRGSVDDSFTYALWRQVRAQQDVFSGVFAYQGHFFNTATAGQKQFASGLYVSGGYFSTLGVGPVIGRTLTEQDDQRGGPAVAVISYAYWQSQFGGDPGVLHRTISLEKHPFQIVGVTQRGFFGTEVGYQFDVAVPLEADRLITPDHPVLDNPMGWWLYAFGRLKPGVSLEAAQARMKALSPFINEATMPAGIGQEGRDWFDMAIEPIPAATGISAIRDNYGRALVLISAMLGMVLLIACANVANLQLARASARRKEFAIRAALGAARSMIVRQLLMESLLLSATGAAAGLLLARFAGSLLVAATSSPRQPSILDLSPDYRVLLFVFGVTVFTALFFGLAPALQLARSGPQDAMKQDSRAALGRRREWSRILVPAQVALSIVLLFGATLFVRSLGDLAGQQLGFHTDGVLLVNTDLDTLPGTDALRQQLAQSLRERLAAMPGVDSASRSAVTPISGESWQWDVVPENEENPVSKIHIFANLVSPSFFRTMGTPMVAGRDFGSQDTAHSPLVAIVNQAAASKLFPEGGSAVGRTYHDSDPKTHPTVRIVAVVGDAKYRRLREAAPPTIYLPLTQNPSPMPIIGTYELHFAGPAASMERAAESAAESVVPQISLEFELLSTQVDDSLRQQRLIAELASVFGILAELLACIGIYGVMAYSVSRRTQEIGVRMALGAGRRNVIWMVMRESLLLVGTGVTIGVPAAIGASYFVRNMLFGVGPSDPLTLGLTVTIMMSAAALAAWMPAARASRTEPAMALRNE